MRILLDECVDVRLRHLFAGHECVTARFGGMAGLKNGELLDAAAREGFEVLVTVDQKIPDQQNLRAVAVAVVILRGKTNRLSDLEALVPLALKALGSVRPGDVVRIP